MDSKFFTNVAVGAVAFFVMGYLVYDLALGAYLSEHITNAREAPIWWSMIASQLALAAIATSAIKWSGSSDFMGGAKAAVGIGFFYGAAYAFDLYGMMDIMDSTGMVATILCESLRFFVSGGVIGWFAGRGK